jgi:translation elongation factor EF-Tu-like GTPase
LGTSAGVSQVLIHTGHSLARSCRPENWDGRTTFGGNPWTLKKEEGGRHTPFFKDYKPTQAQFVQEKEPRKEHTGHVTLMK